MKAVNAGKKVAIHCGAGDSRTGTALFSLMLRQLLEEELANDADNIEVIQKKSESLHMHHGVF